MLGMPDAYGVRLCARDWHDAASFAKALARPLNLAPERLLHRNGKGGGVAWPEVQRALQGWMARGHTALLVDCDAPTPPRRRRRPTPTMSRRRRSSPARRLRAPLASLRRRSAHPWARSSSTPRRSRPTPRAPTPTTRSRTARRRRRRTTSSTSTRPGWGRADSSTRARRSRRRRTAVFEPERRLVASVSGAYAMYHATATEPVGGSLSVVLRGWRSTQLTAEWSDDEPDEMTVGLLN